MAAAGGGRLRRAASALLLRSPRLPARELSAPARLYHKKVVDHYENPRNVGSLDKTSKNVGTGLVGAPACGDVMKLQIQVDEKGKIVDARFKTFGCGSAIASSSLATEWVKGKTMLIINSSNWELDLSTRCRDFFVVDHFYLLVWVCSVNYIQKRPSPVPLTK
ncbi:iron-sulfur cluster assembly enzyme ISCU, mitochondrial isoform X2 [Sapajus apella]|uniref:Iron-sulfur cluster assembly enzyme ISCU, mitochondrial isoform X2 n=1 Tax=Sapajus apella TaxID=9515 RepID=A0A6J3JN65_SAPAP|nr:iron-sulfur cluster assembly enzyme ISCU, mitochondrial isoform X2 [Sapajus apella]